MSVFVLKQRLEEIEKYIDIFVCIITAYNIFVRENPWFQPWDESTFC